ncbi:putative inactive metalloprotease YmfF [Halobacillus andaensis]|uniref:Inactive metalloprotease YmfF n=1 Tax=Halobacillus andaensis TaxID=1176239 RepID=A0A917AZE4_HALAA|nr:pitrilysin family protein [Halobacillus andaensis]MBP2003432.1 putative Zn-dependent peptidase [Halobacillus andaensis]GGF10551.1 putative inactive metalloprotease YmfF [Halobacillus andaensis]
MKISKESVHDKQGYRLHILPSKKYKTVSIVAKLKAPLQREGITERALLPHVLQKATSSHPNVRALQSALENLYGTGFSSDGTKKGENHVLSFRMEVVNEAYLNDHEPILEKAMQIFSDVLFDPKVEQGGFDETIVNREKQTLEQKIKSIKDDRMSYANMRLIDHMCDNEPYALHVHGYLEDFEKINAKSLYEYYKAMINRDLLDLYIIGDVDEAEIEKLADKYFSRSASANNDAHQESLASEKREINEVIEREDVNQGKLHIGYRTNIKFGDDDYFALQVFNGIFGGFPSSKLFMNVREKHSLAYYAASRFESHKGLLLVFSGVDPKDYEQAKSIIIEQMEAMKSGDFTSDQVSESSEQVVNQLQETMDHANGLIEVLYHQTLSGVSIPAKEIIENVRKVKKEDVVKVANKIELDTIYFLTSQKGGEE